MSEDRHGVSWMLEDYAGLVSHVRHGLDDEALSAAVGRSLATVRQIARRLLPREGGKRRSNLASLREVLEDPDYDWQAHLSASYEAEGKPLWSRATDEAMKDAWSRGTPGLPQLAEELRATEESTAKRMVERGVAPSTAELVERLGCTPGGHVEMKARVGRDDAQTSVATLVVLTDRSEVLHAEAHSGTHDFASTLKDLELTHPGARWVIVVRGLGQVSGQDRRGRFRNDDPVREVQESPQDPWGEPQDAMPDWASDQSPYEPPQEDPNPFDLPPEDRWA